MPATRALALSPLVYVGQENGRGVKLAQWLMVAAVNDQ